MPNPFSKFNRPGGLIQNAGGGGASSGFNLALPPGSPLHWYDLTDQSKVWADAAGTIPITDNTIIQRIDDKGSAGDDISDAGSSLRWNINIVNGLAAAQALNNGIPNFVAPVATGYTLPGLSFSAVWRLQVPPGNFDFILAQRDGSNSVEAIITETSGPAWRLGLGNPTSVYNSPAPSVQNQWMWAISTYGPTGPTFDLSGIAELIPGGPAWTDLTGGGNIEILEVLAAIPEIIFWDTILDATEKMHLIAYYENKYGQTFPFI